MTTHYIEVRSAYPDTLDHMYNCLHTTLATIRSGRVGVSFPEMTENSHGLVLRVHGSADDLKALQKFPQTSLLENFPILKAPEDADRVCYGRVNNTSSPESRRNRASRLGRSAPKDVPRLAKRPLFLRSSSGHRFPFWVGTRETDGARFNSYGLGAPVPLF